METSINEWRGLPGFDDYLVSDEGVIKRKASHRNSNVVEALLKILRYRSGKGAISKDVV